jgi:tRNA pseudouridine55 synthase
MSRTAGDRVPDPHPNGIAVVDKDAGWTSHDVVAKARGLLGTRKIGHSGTLDPDATGVLVLGVGRATRLLRFLTLLPKSYAAEIRFGIETSTLDAAGEVTATHDMSGLAPAAVVAAARGFVGAIEQIPPMVSAIKVGGRRLHEMARAGEEIERAPRPVTVMRFDLAPTDDPLIWTAEVECSSGTYVRSLAADLGRALGGGAHLSVLRRTAVGAFTLTDAHPLEQVELLPMTEAARGLGRFDVDEEVAARVAVGAVLDPEVLGVRGEPPWPVFGPDGELLAYYELHKDGVRAKPSVVLTG